MSKQEKIAELEAQIATLKSEIASQKDQHTQEVSVNKIASDAEKAVIQSELDTAQAEVERLEGELEEKQEQLNDRELKKLAQAYEDQESEYKDDADRWFKYSYFVFPATIILFIIITCLANGKPLVDKIEYHLVSLLGLTALVFSLSQFSRFNKLRIDFANRKTMAQAYHNIFTSSDDEVIKDKFLDKAIEVLCAQGDHKPDANTLPEKAFESVIEIAKNLSKT